jgi:hypothetical protein
MTTCRARIVAPLLLAWLACACGGRTLLSESLGPGNVVPGEDSGVGVSEAGTGIGISADSASSCVFIVVAASDLACGSDQDCVLIRSGDVCPGDCGCGDSAVNTAAANRYQSEAASVASADCPCPFSGEPRCLGGSCTLCASTPGQPAGCDDSGVITVEDSGVAFADAGEFDTGEFDTGIPEMDSGLLTVDGSQCVYVDPSSYDRSCTQASDCFVIQTGDVCEGQCACGGLPVNVSGQSRYDEETNGVSFGQCFCPYEGTLLCIGKSCVLSQ